MKRRKASAAIIAAGLLLASIVAAWYFATKVPQPENSELQVSTVENEEDRAPTTEEIEELVSRLASQDQDTFLGAWSPGLEKLIREEAVRDLMVPEGSKVTTSDPLWSDDEDCWTIDVTIETSGYEPVERTLLLGLDENQWYVYETR